MDREVPITSSFMCTPPATPKLPRSQAVHAHTDSLHSEHLAEKPCMSSKQRKEGKEKEVERDRGKGTAFMTSFTFLGTKYNEKEQVKRSSFGLCKEEC